MRKVVVRHHHEDGADLPERLVALLTIGLERYLKRQHGSVVDLARDESVTTTCLDESATRNSASDYYRD